MSYADFLADKTAERVVLIELVETGGTHYISDEGFTTGAADTPANTHYERRLVGDVEISRSMSGPFSLQGGAYNAAELLIYNDADTADWYTKTWQTATIKHGDRTANISTFTTKWTGRIERIEATDTEIRFTLADSYEKLRTEAQRVPHWFGQILGQMRPLSYGYPKNVKPPLTGTSNPDYYVHEAGTVEDQVVARYLNQSSFGSPSIVTETGAYFELNSMPTGTVTVDTKGIRDSGGTWIQTPGDALKHLVSRSVNVLFGYATGGGNTDNLFLDEGASSTDDAYNGLTINCVSQDDPAPPWSSPETGQTISDYDGATKEVTISGTWDGDVSTRQEGDLYHIELSSESNHIGALTDDEVDSAAFTAYDTTLGDPQIGMWIDKGQTYAQVLDSVVHPGGFHAMTPGGKLTIGALVDPSGESADLSLGENGLRGGIEVTAVQPPAWRMKVGYDRNYSPGQPEDSNDVSDTERQIFVSREYSYVRDQDLSIYNEWGDEARDLTFHTVYTELADAQSEFDRYWTLFSSPRYVYAVNAFTEPMSLDLGDVIEVTDPDHGLSSGKNLVLVAIIENLTRGTTEMELWG